MDSKNTKKVWENFDLKQVKQGPGLDIEIYSPYVILPDLRSGGESQFEIDFGKVDVTSAICCEPGHWLFYPAHKMLYMTKYVVKTRAMRFDQVTAGQKYTVFNEDKLDIEVKMPNPSPFLAEGEGLTVDTGIPEAPVFDLGQVDTSLKVDITMDLMKLRLPEHILIKLFDILNNNIMLQDDYTEDFDLSFKSQADKEP